MASQARTDPTAHTFNTKEDTMTSTFDEPVALSGWIRGTLRLVFSRGATVEQPMSLEDARGVRETIDASRVGDALPWHSTAWLQLTSDEVVYINFSSDREHSWPISAEERRKLQAAGHSHGVVSSLLEYWRERGRSDEPSYSPRAILALHQIAVDGVTMEVWQSAARVVEGAKGAARLARAYQAGQESGTPTNIDLDHDGDNNSDEDAGGGTERGRPTGPARGEPSTDGDSARPDPQSPNESLREPIEEPQTSSGDGDPSAPVTHTDDQQRADDQPGDGTGTDA